VVEDENACLGAGFGVVYVVEIGHARREDVQELFEIVPIVDQVLGEVHQPAHLFARPVAIVGDEAPHLGDGEGELVQGRVQIGAAAVEDAGEGGQAVLEFHDLHIAVPQGGDELLQGGDGGDDVAAAVGEDAADAAEL